MKENLSEIPISLKNGYILIQDIKNETTSSGIIIPDETYNRFAKVVKTYDGSILTPGDIIIKPIGRSTPVKIISGINSISPSGTSTTPKW